MRRPPARAPAPKPAPVVPVKAEVTDHKSDHSPQLLLQDAVDPPKPDLEEVQAPRGPVLQ